MFNQSHKYRRLLLLVIPSCCALVGIWARIGVTLSLVYALITMHVVDRFFHQELSCAMAYDACTHGCSIYVEVLSLRAALNTTY